MAMASPLIFLITPILMASKFGIFSSL